MTKSHLSLAAGLSFALLFSGTNYSEIKGQMNTTSFKIPPAFSEILTLTKIKHDGTLSSIVKATQASWLRKPGIERWEMDNAFEKLRKSINPLFKKLGILDEIKPTQKKYNYVVVLGALVSRVRQRLAYALDLWQRGIQFDTLVFLVGARPLDTERESEDILNKKDNSFLPIRKDWKKPANTPKTETDMAKMVFDQADLPQGFKKAVKVVFVDTPMQKKTDGSLRRPNTGDTINKWLSGDTKPGTVLAVSNQPYVNYQHAVLKTLLPATFTVETVGPKASDNLHVGVVLDNIARWLYQENKYQQLKK